MRAEFEVFRGLMEREVKNRGLMPVPEVPVAVIHAGKSRRRRRLSRWSEDRLAYGNGAARLGDSTIMDLGSESYVLQISYPRTALLIGDGTTSSGEALVVAFRSLAGVKIFGAATSGMVTAIEGKRLCDGSVVGISTAAFGDRDGRIYSGKLVPDVPVEQTSSGDANLLFT